MVEFISILKPLYLITFIVTWNAISIIGFYAFAGTNGESKEPYWDLLTFIFAGLYLMYCGFAPVVSEKKRKRWCRPERDFGKAKAGFVLIGIIGLIFALFGGIARINKIHFYS